MQSKKSSKIARKNNYEKTAKRCDGIKMSESLMQSKKSSKKKTLKTATKKI